MALPTNLLETVATYQKAGLAFLLNQYCFINKANKKFKNFQNLTANLGSSVTFDLPTRYTTTSSLTAVFQATEQRKQTLTVDQPISTSYAFNAEQMTFNVEDWLKDFGSSAQSEIGSVIEASVAENALTHTYRFYGDGVTQINSFKQLALAMAYYRNYGAVKTKAYGILSDIAVPEIVDSGLTQFVTKRNDDLAMSWELGSYMNTDWLQSNLLATQIAGTVGVAVQTLTITAITTDADGGISAITCSGGGTATGAINENDLLQFDDGVSGQPDVRYRTFIGHLPSAAPVQIRATATVDSVTDSVIIPISPKLYSVAGNKQNVTQTIAIGMELSTLPSHRAGLIYAGDALYLGMPQLPDQSPFETWNKIDPDSGCSTRMTFGTKFGENEQGMVHDQIWGSTLVDEYAMRIVFPL